MHHLHTNTKTQRKRERKRERDRERKRERKRKRRERYLWNLIFVPVSANGELCAGVLVDDDGISAPAFLPSLFSFSFL